MLARAVLAFESLVILLALPVALRVDHRGPWVWVLLVGLAVLALLAASFAKRKGGLVFGSLVQVAVLLAGFAVPALAVIGALFVVLWVAAIVVGRRGEAVRARRAAQVEAADRRSAEADRSADGPGQPDRADGDAATSR